MSRPEIILIGFCAASLPTIQQLQTGISTTSDALLMDIGRWDKSLAMDIDIAPAEWLLKKSGGEYTDAEVAALSEETHANMVVVGAVGWLKAMLEKFHGVIALAGNVAGKYLF